MIPVLTPEEMAGVDRTAPQPLDVLVARAGAAVARAAAVVLGPSGVYGARVAVIAGPGNNGADGRDAARRLGGRGAKVAVIDAAEVSAGAFVASPDLVVDAAFGTGLSRPWMPPAVGDTPVLAVDIPSGISGLTGEVIGGCGEDGGSGGCLAAAHTVTLAALKPGLLLGAGAEASGSIEVADIGLGEGVGHAAHAWLVTDADRGLLAPRPREANKWQSALHVVAGSPGMHGAPWLVSRAALRTGAGYVRLATPGVAAGAAGLPPGEVVQVGLPAQEWEREVLDGLERFTCLVVGPGLGASGRGPGGETGAASAVGRLVSGAPIPVVVDADGLNALGSWGAIAQVVAARDRPVILTPHAGEFARLSGRPLGADRMASVRDAARRSGAVVLLKGSTTVVAHPDGRVLLSDAGSARLASAGTGDVLSGMIGALVARAVPALEAAALGAHIHGRAASQGRSQGLVASDLPDLISGWLSARVGSPR